MPHALPHSPPRSEHADRTGAARSDGAARPRPLNARQEAFCRSYLTEPTATRAAVMAGYAPDSADVQASRMLLNERILERIADLRREHGLVYDLPRETLLDKLELLFHQALADRKFQAAARAVMLQAQLANLIDQRNHSQMPSFAAVELIAQRAGAACADRMGVPDPSDTPEAREKENRLRKELGMPPR